MGKGSTGEFVVKVNVSEVTAEVTAAVPRTVGLVPVVIDVVGDITAQRR